MLAFGWGERRFYPEVPAWSDLTLGVALFSIFLPAVAAILVTSWSSRPREHEQVHLLRLTPAAYTDLVADIQASFAGLRRPPYPLRPPRLHGPQRAPQRPLPGPRH